MFRASDIFGRKAGENAARPSVALKEKRVLSGPTTEAWDPATGQFVEEELPADLRELIGQPPPSKRIKAEPGKADGQAWGASTPVTTKKVLGPAAAGFGSQSKAARPAAAGARSDAPSVEYSGFSKVDLNDRYYEKKEQVLHGRPSYWSSDGQFFMYWQGDVGRWSLCDAAALPLVKAGQYPGWAYKGDGQHFSQAYGWREAWGGEWRESEVEAIFRMSHDHAPQWNDPDLQRSVTTVEFTGFAMRELNTRYFIRNQEVIQGKPSYWDSSGVYFIYYQAQSGRWAICDLKCLQAVKDGQCPGWAYRIENGHFANAGGWMERRMDQWVAAQLETAVISSASRGLKVEISGFAKPELNTVYHERPDEELQGKPSYWDESATYFLYWQGSFKRWAICDKASLDAVRNGLTPGWAYRADQHHFTRSNTWMEAWGRDWRRTSVVCRILEGTVREPVAAVKAENREDWAAKITVEQYHTLIEGIYKEKNPSKLGDLQHLFTKYTNREHELYLQVCHKYGVNAEALAAEEMGAGASVAEEQAADAPSYGVGELTAGPEDAAAEDDFAELEHADAPEMTATEYAVCIQAVYEKHKPGKLADLAKLLQKYRKRERELYTEVCNKYKEHPAKFHARLVASGDL